MALSEMSSKEKTIVVILGIVIVIALVGIGILAAQLVTGRGRGDQADLVVPESPAASEASPQATHTLVPPPEAGSASKAVPDPAEGQAEAVVREEGLRAGLPVLLAGQALDGSRSYQLEVTTVDGSPVVVSGSWSQTATGAKGKIEMASQRLEGTTPIVVEIEAPLADPKSWIFSASAGPKDLLSKTGPLAIILWDVTESE
jgi:hypothetical protein